MMEQKYIEDMFKRKIILLNEATRGNYESMINDCRIAVFTIGIILCKTYEEIEKCIEDNK